MHQEALVKETEYKAMEVTGGVTAGFVHHMNMERSAFLAALECMYWLAKEELPHTTKYESLLKLCKRLGCTYVTSLDQVCMTGFIIYFQPVTLKHR